MCIRDSFYTFFNTRHGFPTATQFAGISFVTTLPAPIVAKDIPANCVAVGNPCRVLKKV